VNIIDPDHPDSEELRKLFQRLRGGAVSAFAAAEFAMGDLLAAMERSGRFPDTRFYYHVEKRLSQFKKVCLKHSGPSDIKVIEYVTSGFQATIGDRNALAHGFATLFVEERKVEVIKFSPSKELGNHATNLHL